jgi:hypothetical protein
MGLQDKEVEVKQDGDKIIIKENKWLLKNI